MVENTKVTLSDGELAIAMDAQIILTKQVIISTAALLFNNAIPIISSVFSKTLENDITLTSSLPNISKGENYNGFPYVMLDYPSTFSKQNIFAIRTMFWWGNFFSVTLHLSGRYKTQFENNIYAKLNNEMLYVASGEGEWQHHFEPTNYKKATLISGSDIINLKDKKFLKVAVKYDVSQWNNMENLLPTMYQTINDLLQP